MSLDFLFKPKSIALAGAAHNERKLGGVILRNLMKFRGIVYPLNPKYDEVMGLKAYPTAFEMPTAVELAIIMRPATEVPEMLCELKDKAKGAVVMSSGFAETGENELQEEVRRLGKELGIRILGPNCMGIYNPHQRLDTFFLPHERLPRPKKGNVSVVSQSGAILSCLLGVVRESHTGISKAVGYGNAIDIDESEIYDYLAEDVKTEVVVSYIESVGDGRKFISSAKRLSEKKPFIILKSGKGPGGQSAAFSHTGRLAGRYEVFRSVLKQFAIREAMDFDALMDATKALAYQGKMKKNIFLPVSEKSDMRRVCIITNGGGSGVLAADECMRQGLEVMHIPEEKQQRLRGIFPDFYGTNNPIDLTAQVKDEDYASAINELGDSYDGFVIIALPNVLGITEKLAGEVKTAQENIKKPVVSNIASGGISAKITSLLEKARIPVYSSPERAVRGLKALLD